MGAEGVGLTRLWEGRSIFWPIHSRNYGIAKYGFIDKYLPGRYLFMLVLG